MELIVGVVAFILFVSVLVWQKRTADATQATVKLLTEQNALLRAALTPAQVQDPLRGG